MIRLVRALYRMSRIPEYRAYINRQAPEITRFNPGHDAVMMGYDFHVTSEGPRLIEVNTNAGGALLGYLAHHPSAAEGISNFPERLKSKFLHPFAEEMSRFSAGVSSRPLRMAIIDENPEKQYLFQEMNFFSDLFQEWGSETVIADPGGLQAGAEGVFTQGERIDLIYNRHCDFYLESDAMKGIREAYEARKVCLTPNPFAYGLLADKRRMILWTDPARMDEIGVDRRTIDLIQEMVPRSRLLKDMDPDESWRDRKKWVFKPVSLFGSRGVLMGKSISRNRFETLPPEETLVQGHVPPSIQPSRGEQLEMKTDFRLFVYRDRILGVTARLYRGQVTNMQTEGGGFAPVRLI